MREVYRATDTNLGRQVPGLLPQNGIKNRRAARRTAIIKMAEERY